MSVPQLRFKDNKGQHFPDWEEKTVGDYVLSHKGGASLTPSDFIRDGVFEVIPKKAISSGGNLQLDEVEPTYCSKEFFESNQRSVVDSSYLITTLRDLVPSGPSIGYIVKFTNDKQYVLAQGVYGIKIHNRLLGDFLIQYSNTDKYRLLMQTMMVGSTQVHIRNSDFFKAQIFVPSVEEQIRIANFLTTVDRKIDELNRKRDLLIKYKKGVMQQIFSQELRFKDDDGQEFPEWEECTIGEMATQKSKKLNPEKAADDLRCIELEHISQNTGQLLGYVDAHNQKSLKSQFSKGDVLFGKLRPYLRKYLKAPFDGVCSTEIWVLKGNKVTNDFLFHFVQSERFLTVANISSGSKMPRADWDVVASEEAEFPCVAEQSKIANFISAIDDKITAAKYQLEAAKQYKQGLLQQMFI